MTNSKIAAASIFPDIQVSTRDGEECSLIPRTQGEVSTDNDQTWYLAIVYRGKHCPICAKFLNQLQDKLDKFNELNVKLVAVSGDSVEQLNEFYKEKIADVEFPVYANLKIDVMQNLGLYLSEPMSDSETNHIFPEPALFLINHKREVQISEITNAPFIRPNLDILLGGIEHIRENSYPIRGTHIS